MERASARVPAIDHLPNVFMVNQLAPVGGCQSLFDFAEKPLIIVNELFNCLPHQGLRISAPLRGKASQLGLQIRTNIHFHMTQA
jgi:hypothetical protein